MVPETGQKFGPYEILGRVGGGGMGLVFRAWDERLHREVAIKLLYDGQQMPGTHERFLQEARAASKLSHPNICTIYDIGEKDGDPYLVMELLEGETLKEKIVRGALSAEEIAAHSQDVAEALAAAHAKGIVHRDIKPANIFLVNSPAGGKQAKVLDFGLAKIGLREDGGWLSRSLDLTLAGATVGTLAYMSPEQACGQELDARSDLFSLGIVMYEMATRQVPFRGTTSALIYTHLLESEPEPIRKWNESIPKELERLILKLLAKDRRERFQSAKELRDALAKVESKLGKGWWLSRRQSSTPVPLVPATEPVARQRPLRRPSGANVGDAGTLPPTKTADEASSDDNLVIRPRRIAGAANALDQSGLLLISPEGRAARGTKGVGNGSSPKLAFASNEERTSPALARGSSGINQFEFACEAAAEPHAATAHENVRAEHWRWKPVIVAIVAVAVLAVVLSVLWRGGELSPAVLKMHDSLLLAAVQNKTGDPGLDGAVSQGLVLDLQQSHYLKTPGVAATQAGRRLVESDGDETTSRTSAQAVAQRVDAKAYLYGEVRSEGNGYILSVDVLNTQSNDKLASASEVARSREEIPSAIDRLARAIRIEVGEGKQAVANSSLPLQSIATANVDALSEYSAAETAIADGRVTEALAAYQLAAKYDPRFALAQMRLAWLYREDKAEVASSDAAQLAEDSARNSIDRLKLLAEFCYEMNMTGDYGKALATIREFDERFPADVDGLIGLARVLRAQGHMVEALLAAQQAYGIDPHSVEAYEEAELALLNLDRFDDALRTKAQANKFGVIANEDELAIAYLAGKDDVVAKQLASLRSVSKMSLSDGTVGDYGLYLDNTGQLSAGVAVWKLTAADAQHAEALASASASMLAQGALDNALAGSCSDAMELAGESSLQARGAKAIFDGAMANVLCGDKSAADQAIGALRTFPHNTLVAQFYVPALQAVQLLLSKQFSEAFELLSRSESPMDQPLIRYLRGMVEAAMGREQEAIEDFRSVLEHRGTAFLSSGTVYTMAQFQLNRVLAARGNQTDSATAYRPFLVSWGKSDSRSEFVGDASARTTKPGAGIARALSNPQ